MERGADGGLRLNATPGLARLRSENPDLLFVVRADRGHEISEGAIPQEFASVEAALNYLSQARLRGSAGDTASTSGVVKWVDAKAGMLQMLTPARGQASVRKVIATAHPLFLNVVLPIMGVMTFATPFVVRRAMAGLGQAAGDAERIDIHGSGLRLSVNNVPAEVIPFVKAVNRGVYRLDAGHEKHKRFQ